MTLAEATANYSAALTAYQASLSGKSVQYNGKSVTAHDVDKLRGEVAYWDEQVRLLNAASSGATNPGVRIATWS